MQSKENQIQDNFLRISAIYICASEMSKYTCMDFIEKENLSSQDTSRTTGYISAGVGGG